MVTPGKIALIMPNYALHNFIKLFKNPVDFYVIVSLSKIQNKKGIFEMLQYFIVQIEVISS